MKAGNANIVVEFLSINWEQFLAHCEDFGLDENVAEEIYQDVQQDAEK